MAAHRAPKLAIDERYFAVYDNPFSTILDAPSAQLTSAMDVRYAPYDNPLDQRLTEFDYALPVRLPSQVAEKVLFGKLAARKIITAMLAKRVHSANPANTLLTDPSITQ